MVMAVRAVLKEPFEKVAPLALPTSLFTIHGQPFYVNDIIGPTSQVEQLEGT